MRKPMRMIFIDKFISPVSFHPPFPNSQGCQTGRSTPTAPIPGHRCGYNDTTTACSEAAFYVSEQRRVSITCDVKIAGLDFLPGPRTAESPDRWPLHPILRETNSAVSNIRSKNSMLRQAALTIDPAVAGGRWPAIFRRQQDSVRRTRISKDILCRGSTPEDIGKMV